MKRGNVVKTMVFTICALIWALGVPVGSTKTMIFLLKFHHFMDFDTALNSA